MIALMTKLDNMRVTFPAIVLITQLKIGFVLSIKRIIFKNYDEFFRAISNFTLVSFCFLLRGLFLNTCLTLKPFCKC